MRGRRPGGRPRLDGADSWVDVWAHLPEELKEKIRQRAAESRASLLDVIEGLLWLGLLRMEEQRQRATVRKAVSA